MICLNSKHNLLCGIRAAINSEIVLLQIKALRLKKKVSCVVYLWCRRKWSVIRVVHFIPCLATMLILYVLKLLQPCSKIDSLVRIVDVIVFRATVLAVMNILRERNSWRCSAYLASATEWVCWDSFEPCPKYLKRRTLLHTWKQTQQAL